MSRGIRLIGQVWLTKLPFAGPPLPGVHTYIHAFWVDRFRSRALHSTLCDEALVTALICRQKLTGCTDKRATHSRGTRSTRDEPSWIPQQVNYCQTKDSFSLCRCSTRFFEFAAKSDRSRLDVLVFEGLRKAACRPIRDECALGAFSGCPKKKHCFFCCEILWIFFICLFLFLWLK